jgi:hypothetical protein
MAGIFLAKLWNGQVASFVRSDGDLLVVSVAGQERKISRDVWRQLPEQHGSARRREHGHGQQGPAGFGLRRSEQ